MILQNVKIEESIDSQGATKKISKTEGLIWVLYGNRYILQNSSELDVKVGQKFIPNDTIASQKLINNHPGIINFQNFSNDQAINIIN